MFSSRWTVIGNLYLNVLFKLGNTRSWHWGTSAWGEGKDHAGFEIYWEAKLPEAGIKLFEDTDSKNRRAATTKRGIMEMFAC
jgi:hypothetical protein